MSFKDIDINDIPDIVLLESGSEQQLTIESAALRRSEKGRLMLALRLGSLAQPEAENIFDNVCFPVAEDTKRTERMMKTRLLGFTSSFGVDINSIPDEAETDAQTDTKEGFELTDWAGASGYAIVDIEQDNQGNPRNVIKQYING